MPDALADNEVTEVTQVNSLTAKRDEGFAHVMQLRGRQSALLGEIDEATDEVKNGSIPGSVRLNSLAVEKSEIDHALKAAEKELASIEAELRSANERERVKQFQAAVERARRLRGEVITAIREASLRLADFYAACGEARHLANRATTPNGVGTCWPHELAALREVSDPHVDPYDGDKWLSDKLFVAIDLNDCPRVKPVRRL